MSKFADSPYFLLKDYMKVIVAPPNPEYLQPDVYNMDTRDFATLYTDVIYVGGVTNIMTSSPYTDSITAFPDYNIASDTANIFEHADIKWNGWLDRSPESMYYLSFKDKDGIDTETGVLMRGMEKSIIVDGGQYINLWAKLETGFVPIRLKPLYEDPIDKQFFRFDEVEIQVLNYDGTVVSYDSDVLVDEPYFDSDTVSIQTYDYTYTNIFGSGIVLEPGTEIYIRKDSNFHNWLRTESFAKQFYRDEFELDFITRNYVNTDKLFLYFGKIYASPTDSLTTDRYQIEFYGLKDWIQRALPPNNRKELFIEFLDYYFDMVYHEGYSQLKDVWSLRDAMECNETFLAYVPTFYGVPRYDDIPSWFADIYREYARDVVWLLKRKGTYSSLYIIEDLFCRNSNNIFNVMERWHDNGDIAQIKDYVYTGRYGRKLNGGVYIISAFTDNLVGTLTDGFYENLSTTTDKWGINCKINVTISGGIVSNVALSSERGTGYQVGDTLYIDCTGIEGYESGTLTLQVTEVLVGGAGNFWYQKTFSETYPDGYLSSLGERLSPWYRADLDLSVEPLTLTKIMPKQIAENLYRNWEMMRPINRQAEYNFVYSPYCDLSGQTFSIYERPNTTQSITSALKNVSFDDDNFIHVQYGDSYVWEVEHKFNDLDVIVTTYGSDFKKIVADEVRVVDSNNVLVTHSVPTKGFVVITRALGSDSVYKIANWRIIHAYDRQEVLIQVRSVVDDTVVYPDSITSNSTQDMYINGLDPTGDYKAFIQKGLKDGESIAEDSDPLDASIWTFPNAVYNPLTGYWEWVIEHGFDGNIFMVNCYDSSNELIVPVSVDEGQLDSLENPRIVISWSENVSGFAAIRYIGDAVSFGGILPRDGVGDLKPVEWRLTVETEDEVYTFLQENSSDAERFANYTKPINYWDGDKNNRTYPYGTTIAYEEDELWAYYTVVVTDEGLKQLNIKNYDILGIELSNPGVKRVNRQRMIYSRISGIYKPFGVNFVCFFRVYKNLEGFPEPLV